jgi:hypothetical protein
MGPTVSLPETLNCPRLSVFRFVINSHTPPFSRMEILITTLDGCAIFLNVQCHPCNPQMAVPNGRELEAEISN